MKIHFENDAVMVIEKPAGMPCLSQAGGISPTVSEMIALKHPKLREGAPDAPPENGIVHRLDNDTSGLLIVAKTKETYSNLREQFDSGSIKKGYIALVVGDPPDEMTIETPIAHHPRKKKKMVACDSKKITAELKARNATTHFKVIERFVYEKDGRQTPYALLEVSIETGVRHQIRLHLASVSFPISGDRLYMNQKKRHMDTLRPKRHLLHARSLEFADPATKEIISLDSPIPEDLEGALKNLRSGVH